MFHHSLFKVSRHRCGRAMALLTWMPGSSLTFGTACVPVAWTQSYTRTLGKLLITPCISWPRENTDRLSGRQTPERVVLPPSGIALCGACTALTARSRWFLGVRNCAFPRWPWVGLEGNLSLLQSQDSGTPVWPPVAQTRCSKRVPTAESAGLAFKSRRCGKETTHFRKTGMLPFGISCF